jgi:hypothetical protein
MSHENIYLAVRGLKPGDYLTFNHDDDTLAIGANGVRFYRGDEKSYDDKFLVHGLNRRDALAQDIAYILGEICGCRPKKSPNSTPRLSIYVLEPITS